MCRFLDINIFEYSFVSKIYIRHALVLNHINLFTDFCVLTSVPLLRLARWCYRATIGLLTALAVWKRSGKSSPIPKNLMFQGRSLARALPCDGGAAHPGETRQRQVRLGQIPPTHFSWATWPS